MFSETYCTIILKRIFTAFSDGYVDLMSPSGLLSNALCMIMMVEFFLVMKRISQMKDDKFLIGTVDDSWDELINAPVMKEVHKNGINDFIAGCDSCAFNVYCGTDPVFHHASQGDSYGFRPTSSFCKKNKSIIKYLFELMESDPQVVRIFKSWIKMVEEIKQTFRGIKIGEFDDLFVGIVVKVDSFHKSLKILGRSPYSKSSEYEIVLSSEKLSNLTIGVEKIDGLNHININDIILVSGNKIRSIFRNKSNSNSIFATVRCNSNCLMCSQPPLDYDDTVEFYHIWKYAISLMPNNIQKIGITGGEPTLMGEKLVLLINQLIDKNRNIHIDILSNGRLQAKQEYENTK